jgi:phosphatidylglycerophosphate synthase
MTWPEVLITCTVIVLVADAGNWQWWLPPAVSFALAIIVSFTREYVRAGEEDPDR